MNELVRVNVGCGMTPTPGWLNLDNSWSVRLARTPAGRLLGGRRAFAEAVRQHNIRYAEALALPVADGAARIVYSSHMVEHLDRGEARAFLAEALRILAPGGAIRLVVPDVGKAVADYQRHGDADRLVGGLLMSRPRARGFKAKLAEVSVGFRDHRWMYDAQSLCRVVGEAGFRDVVALPPGETRLVDPGALDLAERDDESCYVEGVKP